MFIFHYYVLFLLLLLLRWCRANLCYSTAYFTFPLTDISTKQLHSPTLRQVDKKKPNLACFGQTSRKLETTASPA